MAEIDKETKKKCKKNNWHKYVSLQNTVKICPQELGPASGISIWRNDALNFDRGADKSLARPTSRCILFDGENISFDASLVI